MRINVYNEEITHEVDVVTVEPRPGRVFIGVRCFLESSEKLHHQPNDDDRSAITFWLGNYDAAIHYFQHIVDVLEGRRLADTDPSK